MLTTMFGIVVYVLIGLLASSITTDHVNNLCKEVASVDPRYKDRLWFTIQLKRTKIMEFVVDVVFMVFWPIFCVAAILKAEWQYDLIVHHSAFDKGTVQ